MKVHTLDSVVSTYKTIEAKTPIEYHLDKVTYDSPVNFNESLKTPRHRWFPYKEGFSPSFVRSFFHRYITGDDIRVLDPFSGVGTTVIEAALMGQYGVGIEVNPLAIFISDAKRTMLSHQEVLEFDTLILEFEHSELLHVSDYPKNETVISYFEPEYLDALLRTKAFLLKISPSAIQKLFKVAFLSIVEVFSTHRKAGNGLKRRTKLLYHDLQGETPIDKIKQRLVTHLNTYQHDLSVKLDPSTALFIQGSSLRLDDLAINTDFNAVLTSPPYANCFDYSKIYMCELWLGDFFTSRASQQSFRMQSVRSHVHATWPSRYDDMGSILVNEEIFPQLERKKLWSKNISTMLSGYFMDLGQLFSSLASVLETGSPLGFVVGNSVYGGIPIATDLILSDMAEHYGFQTERIEVYRYIVPSSQQYVQVESKEYMRESMVVLRKM